MTPILRRMLDDMGNRRPRISHKGASGHWDPTPETARESNFAKTFREQNPGAPIRVLLIDAPITHYGHIERPKQLVAVLLEAVRWVMQE